MDTKNLVNNKFVNSFKKIYYLLLVVIYRAQIKPTSDILNYKLNIIN